SLGVTIHSLSSPTPLQRQRQRLRTLSGPLRISCLKKGGTIALINSTPDECNRLPSQLSRPGWQASRLRVLLKEHCSESAVHRAEARKWETEVKSYEVGTSKE